jgi:osmotically-inducible protein OsmY
MTHDPDQRIRQAAKEALSASGYRSLAAIDCQVDGGVVRLSGVVSSYYLKQVAQEVVLQLELVHSIHNSVQVRPW